MKILSLKKIALSITYFLFLSLYSYEFYDQKDNFIKPINSFEEVFGSQNKYMMQNNRFNNTAYIFFSIPDSLFNKNNQNKYFLIKDALSVINDLKTHGCNVLGYNFDDSEKSAHAGLMYGLLQENNIIFTKDISNSCFSQQGSIYTCFENGIIYANKLPFAFSGFLNYATQFKNQKPSRVLFFDKNRERLDQIATACKTNQIPYELYLCNF